MKGFLKILGMVILIPYIIVTVIITVFLLNYNEYGVTELGNKTLINVDGDELTPTYKKGDLLVVEKTTNADVNINDYIFFYEQNHEKKTVIINMARVINKEEVNESETTYQLEGNFDISSEYVIGNTNNVKVYSSLGSIVSALESRWVFLLFIIVPMLFIFLYELYAFAIEVKKNMKEA